MIEKARKLIKEYQEKVKDCEHAIIVIIDLIRKGRAGDTTIDIDDLREEKRNANKGVNIIYNSFQT